MGTARWADAALDLFLGSTCAGCGVPGRVLCPPCAATLPSHGAPAQPTPSPAGLVRVVAGGEYDGTLRELVLAHKERGRLALARPLGVVLAGAVGSLLVDPDADPDPDPGLDAGAAGPVPLVPVPSARAVVRRRGHDPVLRMAREAASVLRGEGRAAVVRPLLVPARRVQDQAGLGAEARSRNLAGAYRARRRAAVLSRGAPVVLVDDVVTTGATAREAQRALEEVGVGVLGVAVVAATHRKATAGSLPDVSIRD